MKKTFVTTMPDRSGAFLQATRAMADLGLNITRVSYNKAVDIHTLFIEVDGTPDQLLNADHKLRDMGYLSNNAVESQVLLLEFTLPDVPGTVTRVLELIGRYDFNLSYLSSHGDGSGYQRFKMGLFVEDHEKFSRFLKEASKLCSVRVLDYNQLSQSFDNSIFYISFANELAARMGLDENARNNLVIQSNLVMQLLDEHGGSPAKTFEYIGKFGEALSTYRGEAFLPRISEHTFGDITLTLIEPPCGSNTTILRYQDEYLFVDSGYACYKAEMLHLFHAIIPDFDTCKKSIVVTHADLDHCGLLHLFDTVYVSRKSQESLVAEYYDGEGFRERNHLHAPYIRICKILTSYVPPAPETLRVIAGTSLPLTEPLVRMSEFFFGPLFFEVWEGSGGHLPGEIMLVDREHKIAFTGDIFINIKDTTKEQAAYNRYAPYLMTSVDTEPEQAGAQRKAMLQALGSGEWNIFGGHGYRKTLTIE